MLFKSHSCYTDKFILIYTVSNDLTNIILFYYFFFLNKSF